jgi:hypothetical protein
MATRPRAGRLSSTAPSIANGRHEITWSPLPRFAGIADCGRDSHGPNVIEFGNPGNYGLMDLSVLLVLPVPPSTIEKFPLAVFPIPPLTLAYWPLAGHWLERGVYATFLNQILPPVSFKKPGNRSRKTSGKESPANPLKAII